MGRNQCLILIVQWVQWSFHLNFKMSFKSIVCHTVCNILNHFLKVQKKTVVDHFHEMRDTLSSRKWDGWWLRPINTMGARLTISQKGFLFLSAALKLGLSQSHLSLCSNYELSVMFRIISVCCRGVGEIPTMEFNDARPKGWQLWPLACNKFGHFSNSCQINSAARLPLSN